MEELENVLAIPREEVILASAKEGTGVDGILEAIVERVPPPKGDPAAPLQGLIFDSHYDAYKGVVAYVRLAEGTLHAPRHDPADGLGRRGRAARAGRVPAPARAGRAARGRRGRLRRDRASRASATRRSATRSPTPTARRRSRCPATRRPRASSSPGIYPLSGEDYPLLRDALEKLHLNDASFTYEPESSVALGFGFRCGFLGLLHMEIVQERLEREFDLDLIASAPSVEYRVAAHARPRAGRRRQPGAAARRRRDRGDRGAVGQAQRRHAEPLHRPAHGALDEPPRHLRRAWSTSTRSAC